MATLPLTASSAAPGAPAVSPGTDPQNGFPVWYQDSAGNRVEPCIDPNDPNCVLPAGTAFDPTQPVMFPTNFPDEFFYASAPPRTWRPRVCRDRSGPGAR